MIENDENGRIQREFNLLDKIIHQELAGFITVLIEEQTKTRIKKDKTAPDGTKWKAWSPSYARTRDSRHSLLIGTGDLLQSIFAEYGDDKGSVIASASYAENHQFGSGNIPARPFFGLSEENTEEIYAEISDFFRRRLG